MKLFIVSLLIAFGLTTQTVADDHAGGLIQQVIAEQLTAFLNEDASAAWQHAHSSIKAKFGSADTFLSMVQQAYSPMMSFTQLEFLSLTAMEDSWLQKVRLMDRRGDRYELYYVLVETQANKFEIAGVSLEANNGI